MIFEWHDGKSERNRRERGFGFDFAALIFDGATIEWEDTRQDYGETRMVAVGRVDNLFVTVVYTDWGEVRRIISAWPSNRKERERWPG